MISYAANYPDDIEGIAGAKIINHQPLFNDRNTVEFAIGRDKRFIKLSETELNLQIEIPDNYYPDNDVTSKLFENLELIINHEGITHKSSALDYSITNYLFLKTTFDDTFLKLSMDTQGVFDSHSLDAPEFAALKIDRGNIGEKLWINHEFENKSYQILYRRYHFTVKLNHGLARSTHCLPADTLLTLRFHRAKSNFALLKISDQVTARAIADKTKELKIDYSYPFDVIPIKQPTLSVFYSYSPELESSMNRIRSSSIEIPFYDYNARRIILDEGLSSHDIDIMQGGLPKFMMFMFASLERLNGSELLSLTRFEQREMINFDLILGLLFNGLKYIKDLLRS